MNITKEGNDMKRCPSSKFEEDSYSNSLEDLKKSVELLEEAVEFINLVPNNKYGVDSYKLASKIDRFLKTL